MKQFQFTLEAVQTWRRRLEQAAQGRYAQALQAAREAARRLEVVEAELGHFQQAWNQSLRGGCTASEIVHGQLHGAFLEGRRGAIRREIAEKDRATRQALDAMLAARQKRELVDKLRDRLRSRHDSEAARAAQSEMDDLAATRHLLRGGAAETSPTSDARPAPCL